MNKNRKFFSLLSNLFTRPVPKQVWIALGVVFVSFIQFALPTGWLYDLGVGTGTEQGQRPDQSVQTVHTQDEVEDFFFQNTPATVSKTDLILCPLMCLRDKRAAGEYTESYSKTTHMQMEYCIMDHPMTFKQKVFSHFAGLSLYNRYHLAPLDDGSYICVYFDDYLLLTFGDELPTGYIRPAEPEEIKMLHLMTTDYEVDTAYVLDMYRHGKVNWMLDSAIRFAICIAGIVVALEVHEKVKKERKVNRSVNRSRDDLETDSRSSMTYWSCVGKKEVYHGKFTAQYK